MSDQVDIKISESLIKGIIESKVQTAITEALSKDKGVVERVVASALTMMVGEDCNVSKYSSDNKYTFLDALCRKLIREAALVAVQKWAEDRKEVLEREFLHQLQTKKVSNLMVRACVDGLIDATKNKWRFTVCFPDE